jgi:hypothetical protein
MHLEYTEHNQVFMMRFSPKFTAVLTSVTMSALCILALPEMASAQATKNPPKKVPVPALLPGVALLGAWAITKRRKQTALNTNTEHHQD